MLAFRAQVSQDRQRFDSLPEAHLVADDDFALDEGEAGGEALVATQRRLDVVGQEFLGSNGLDDLLGEIAMSLLVSSVANPSSASSPK